MSEPSPAAGARPGRVVAGATVVLAAVAAVLLLYAGHDVLVPVTLALVLATLLEPIVSLLRRARVPPAASAVIAVLATVVLLVVAGAALADPLRALAAVVPQSVAKARVQLAHVSARVASLRALGAPVPNGTPAPPGAPPSPGGPGGGPGGGGLPSSVVAMAGRVFGTTGSLLAETVEVLLLALFVLAAGDAWRDKVQAAVASPEKRRATLDTAREMRVAVTRYVLVTAVINAAQAALVALVAWLAGLPSPALWGILTFVAEFVPYLGGAALIALLFVVGLATTDSLVRALLAPAAYLLITTVQNNLVSPIAYGRNLCLAPAAILVAVMFWFAVWGVAGAFLAVPILAAVRVLSRHVKALRPVGIFLEG